MSVEIIVPNMGESVVEATVAQWIKKVGDAVKAGDDLVELEDLPIGPHVLINAF